MGRRKCVRNRKAIMTRVLAARSLATLGFENDSPTSFPLDVCRNAEITVRHPCVTRGSCAMRIVFVSRKCHASPRLRTAAQKRGQIHLIGETGHSSCQDFAGTGVRHGRVIQSFLGNRVGGASFPDSVVWRDFRSIAPIRTVVHASRIDMGNHFTRYDPIDESKTVNSLDQFGNTGPRGFQYCRPPELRILRSSYAESVQQQSPGKSPSSGASLGPFDDVPPFSEREQHLLNVASRIGRRSRDV
jgi:hypothetical protein